MRDGPQSTTETLFRVFWDCRVSECIHSPCSHYFFKNLIQSSDLSCGCSRRQSIQQMLLLSEYLDAGVGSAILEHVHL